MCESGHSATTALPGRHLHFTLLETLPAAPPPAHASARQRTPAQGWMSINVSSSDGLCSFVGAAFFSLSPPTLTFTHSAFLGYTIYCAVCVRTFGKETQQLRLLPSAHRGDSPRRLHSRLPEPVPRRVLPSALCKSEQKKAFFHCLLGVEATLWSALGRDVQGFSAAFSLCQLRSIDGLCQMPF